MITIINHLRNKIQYPSSDIRHALNNFNHEMIKEIERRLRGLNPDQYTGTLTVFEDREGIYKIDIDSSDADTAKRVIQLVQPYLDSLNNWSDQ